MCGKMNFDFDVALFVPRTHDKRDYTAGTHGPYDPLSNSPFHNSPHVLSYDEPNHYVTAAPSSPHLSRGNSGRVPRLLAFT